MDEAAIAGSAAGKIEPIVRAAVKAIEAIGFKVKLLYSVTSLSRITPRPSQGSLFWLIEGLKDTRRLKGAAWISGVDRQEKRGRQGKPDPFLL